MKPPTPASLVFFLASICALLASTGKRGERISIDRSFLPALSRYPLDRDPTPAEVESFAKVIWESNEELRYLIRIEDPDAVRLSVAMIASGKVPGGCVCDADEFTADLVHSGMPTVAWLTIGQLPPARAARFLCAIDAHPYDESDAQSTWQLDRDTFLARRPDVHIAYEALIAPKQVMAWPQNHLP